MTRLALKLALIPLCLLTAALLFIRVQPYDDAELRAFLTPPDGCMTPCFLGIQPGITTVEKAIELLEAHEWVQEVRKPISPFGEVNALEWTWSGRQPRWINPLSDSYFASSNPIRIDQRGNWRHEQQTVESVVVYTTIPFGSLYSVRSKDTMLDQQNLVSTYEGVFVPLTSYLRYHSSWAYTSCSMSPMRYWNTSVILVLDFAVTAYPDIFCR
jgi:hypothetical protein